MPTFIAALVWGALVFIVIYLTFLRQDKVSKFVHKYYGPPRLPVIGSMWELAGSRVDRTQRFFFDWPKNHGPRYSFHILSNNFFSSTKHEDVEKILSSTTNIFKGKWYEFFGPLVYGLVGLAGAPWAKRRKMVNPSFHFSVLQGFQKTFDEQSKFLVSLWKKDHADGIKFDITPYISRCTLDVICETAMGVEIGAQKDPEHKYVQMIDQGMRLIQSRATKPWLQPNWIWKLSPQGRQFAEFEKYSKSFRDNIIASKRAEARKKLEDEAKKTNGVSNGVKPDKKTDDDDGDDAFTKKKVAFLDHILAARDDEGFGMTDEDLGCEVDTFIAAGQDTTSHATAWCSFLLACNPEEQEKVIAELDEIFGDDRERPVTSDDLSKMKYLEYCVKEALRIRPSVPFIIRTLVEDLVLSDGEVVPAGINMMIHIMRIHHDPETYPKPDQFIPERFLPENCKTRHHYAWIPFSMGPRFCIGHKYAVMEEKTLLANILRNFRLQTDEKLADVPVTADITLRPSNGLFVSLKPR